MTALFKPSAGAGTPGQFYTIGMGQNDDVLQLPDYRLSKPNTRDGMEFPHADFLWPRGSLLGSGGQDGMTTGGGGILQSANQIWEWNTQPTGNHTRKVVAGVVRDSQGLPVSGATVQLFNTATGALVDTQTSASDGTYACGDPNAVASFTVGYKTGSPDREGTTVNTLTGV